MRKAALAGIVVVLAAFAAWLALPGGGAADAKPTLAAAAARTAQARSERYAIHVVLTRAGAPVSLHISGQAGRHTISVRMAVGAVRLPDGSSVPGPNGAALLDGPFLYERAPRGVALGGGIHWLRLDVPSLAPTSAALDAVHAMTPTPVLDVLRAAHVGPHQGAGGSFSGTVAYDDPAVTTGLTKLTGGLQFRDLHVWATLGGDGLVHRVVLTGRTADGRTTFSLHAHLFAFGRGLHVTPPAPGTFVDQHSQLTA